MAGLPAASPEPRPSTTPASTTTETAASETTAAPTTTEASGIVPMGRAVDEYELLSVVGIRYDDVLRVRSQPGVDARILARLPPHAHDIAFTGRTTFLESGLWYEVIVDDETGWASGSYLGRLGATDDATQEAIDLAGRPPQAESVHGLGRSVAGLFAPTGPPARVRVTDPGTIGPTGVVTVDVTDDGDGPIAGYRLVLRSVRLADESGYVLTDAERTVICRAGAPVGTCE